MYDLANSIKEYGILQPITVRPIRGEQSYELIAGERRLRAAKIAGLTSVPAIVYSAGDNDSAVLALIENLQREDLNPIESALAIKELIEKYKHTKWNDLTPFEAGVLISKFNLVQDSEIGLYVGKNTCFMPWHFVGDTLQTDKERKEAELKKVKQENKLSSLSNPIADKNAVTLEQIETVLNTQKSSPKANKAIKELIKIR